MKNKLTLAYAKIKEEELNKDNSEPKDEDEIIYFYGATTLPDRVAEALDNGEMIKGEILDVKVLEKMADQLNDKSKLGGKIGSHRTIGLFHDRVHSKNLALDEAGFVVPGTARVEPLPDYPGHFGLKLGTKLNKYYTPSEMYPDYSYEKLKYKIDNGVIGLSMEYNNRPEHEHLVSTEDGYYRYISDTDDFRGFSFARANLIGNPTAVSIKEIQHLVEKQNRGNEMADTNETEIKLKESEAKVQELTAKLKELESRNAEDPKLKEINEELAKVKEKLTSQKLELDTTASKIKESIELAFSGLKFENSPIANIGKVDTKLKEVYDAMDVGAKTKEWSRFIDVCETRVKEQYEHFDKVLKTEGIRMEDTTLKVKCVGRNFVIEPTVKTKDVIDTGSMNEATYYQTNAMFADKYVPGIVETFQKSDSLLSAMMKESYTGGNDKYQWRIWTEFDTFTGDNTAAVDPDVTAVATKKRDFIKLETPIREYRQAVEVTDFTQYHSRAAVGDLLMQEAIRAAEVVTNSLNADLYKGKCDATTGWLGVNGILAIADSTTYSTLYGKVRSTSNMLKQGTLDYTYDDTAEAISISLIREGYAYVNSAGTNISDMAIVMHPHQWIRVLNTQDDAAATYTSTVVHPITMSAADPAFGFKRNIIPHIDGIPVILDEYCTDATGAADTFVVVDMSKDGFVLVTSKPIGMTGLAKVGTTEKVYVNWYGTAVYKKPRNIHLHDGLTLLGA
jgi:DNA-binding transcriptional MerR regulator